MSKKEKKEKKSKPKKDKKGLPRPPRRARARLGRKQIKAGKQKKAKKLALKKPRKRKKKKGTPEEPQVGFGTAAVDIGKLKNPSLLRYSIKEQVFFAKRLSFLIHASVPMLDSLHIIQRQTKSKRKKQMFDQIIEDVRHGQFLATSLGKFKRVFGDFAVSIIHTGETSGTLDESLVYLAEELEKKQKLRRKVFGALVYPALIITATLGVVGLLTIYVFPKILPIFASLDFELPFTTKALIWITDFLTAWGLWIAGGTTILGVLAAWLIAIKEDVHYVWDKIIIKIPLLGQIALNYQIANLTRTIGLLLKADVGVVDSLSIAGDTTNSIAYRRALKEVANNVIKGESISTQLALRPDLFPDLATQMIAIGERTGRLSDTFTYLSGLYEEEVDNLTKNLSNAIEPILMVTLGVIVGFIAISIITPIYQVTQNLNP